MGCHTSVRGLFAFGYFSVKCERPQSGSEGAHPRAPEGSLHCDVRSGYPQGEAFPDGLGKLLKRGEPDVFRMVLNAGDGRLLRV